MRTRLIAACGVILALSFLSGCGDNESSAPKNAKPETSATPSPTPPPAPPTKVNFENCSAITVKEIAPLLGEGKGTSKKAKKGNGCTYALDNPKLPSVFVEQFTTSDFAGGWDGAHKNVNNTVIGSYTATPQDVSGVGDAAVVITQTGDKSDQAMPDSRGLVRVGDNIIRTSMLDASGLNDEQLHDINVNILKLIASKL
jgi:hypothetical protein